MLALPDRSLALLSRAPRKDAGLPSVAGECAVFVIARDCPQSILEEFDVMSNDQRTNRR